MLEHVHSLFNKPAVREELFEVRIVPHLRDMSEVNIEVVFNNIRGLRMIFDIVTLEESFRERV